MPKYDYKCPECERVDEIIHSMDYSGSIACPDCFVQMKKVFAPTAISFKGQGWGGIYRKHTPKKND